LAIQDKTKVRKYEPSYAVCEPSQTSSLPTPPHDEKCRESTIRKGHKGHEDRNLWVASVFVLFVAFTYCDVRWFRFLDVRKMPYVIQQYLSATTGAP
jgi:hypothetical protein